MKRMGIALLLASSLLGGLTLTPVSADTRATYLVFAILFGFMGLLSFVGALRES